MISLHNINCGLIVKSTATTKDWILAIISLSPILPWFIFCVRLYKKITVQFNWNWAFKWYNQTNINVMFLEETKYELW